MLKRFMAAVLVLMMLTGLWGTALAEYPMVNAVITIDGVRAAFFKDDGTYLPPVEVNGLVYVPVMSLSESLGLNVTADPEKLMVTVNDIRTAFFAEDGTYLPPVAIDGLVYVPLESFIISAGLFVEVEDNKISITRNKPEPTAAPVVMVTAEPIPAYGLVPLDENNFWDYFGYSVNSSYPSSFDSPIKIYYYVNFAPLTPYEPINVSFSVKVGDRSFGKAVMTGDGEVKLTSFESYYGSIQELANYKTQAILWEMNTPEVRNVSGSLRMSGMEAMQINGQDYDRAVEYMEKELFDLAEPIFVRLSRVDFKDSKEMVKTIRQRKQEKIDQENAARQASYQDAVKKQEEGLFSEAIAIFTELGDYSDSAQQILKCHYLQAEFQLEKKNYAAADTAFKAAGEYRDAAGRIGEGYYTQAEALLAENKYDEAAAAFRNAGKYKDAAKRVGEPYYKQAEVLLAEKKYAEASQAFAKAGNYENAADRVLEPFYLQAKELLASGKYSGASEAFKKAGSYADAASLINMPYYVQAEAYLAEGKTEQAIGSFILAGDYSDAAQRIVQIRIGLAEEAMAAEKWDEASAEFDKAGAKDRVGEPYMVWGDKLLAADDPENAIIAYTKALKKDSKDAEAKIKQAHTVLASKAEAASDWETALNEYLAAGEEEKANNAKYRLAEGCILSGDYSRAQTLFAELGEYSDAAKRGLEVHFRKGEKAQAEKNYVLAQTEYRNAGSYEGAAQKIQEVIRLEADALTAKEQYDEAYLLYMSIMDDSIREMIKANQGLKKAASAWKNGVQAGKVIKFGSYDLHSDPENNHADLEWLVLAREENKALVWCLQPVDKRAFQNNTAYVTWGHSDLRYWLNNGFMAEAFTPAQRAAIMLTDVKNKKDKESEASPGNHTKDYLFCLDKSEFEKYLVKNTRNAALIKERKLPAFWLRSLKTQTLVWAGNGEGKLTYNGAKKENYSACPAMWIDLNNQLFK